MYTEYTYISPSTGIRFREYNSTWKYKTKLRIEIKRQQIPGLSTKKLIIPLTPLFIFSLLFFWTKWWRQWWRWWWINVINWTWIRFWSPFSVLVNGFFLGLNGEHNDDEAERDDDTDLYECRKLSLDKFLVSLLCAGHWFALEPIKMKTMMM